MGQSSSSSSSSSSAASHTHTTASSTRHDNASTRTLHSTSMHSQQQRPVSFFRRISNRLHVAHPTRRFGRPNRQASVRHHHHHHHHQQQQQQHHTQQQYQYQRHQHHTSASSTTSSVRRATQEATRQAAAVTGPPTSSFLIHSASSTSTTPPPPPPVPLNSSRNSIISSSDTTYLNELLSSAVFRDSNSVHSSSQQEQQQQRGNSFLRYLQLPLRMQDTASSNTTPPQSSASSTTSRRMHILVIEYRTNNNTNPVEDTTTPLTPPPTYRFLGLRRPRSEVSTTSSTETIQSMPLSMNSTQTGNRTLAASQQQQQQQEGQWIVYVLNSNNTTNANATPLQALSSSLVLEDNPSYEDLLWLTNMLGPARPNTTTQAAVDEAIPVTQWSNEDIKDEQCLVCLDEFAFKQPVRVLKCHHRRASLVASVALTSFEMNPIKRVHQTINLNLGAPTDGTYQ
ncbi:hypothetical protein MBANPS3_001429 [Mucor bainieri]